MLVLRPSHGPLYISILPLFTTSLHTRFMNNTPEIEILHDQTIRKGLRTYVDPYSNYNVFTEVSHLKRGSCCGSHCRHCPYGLENVDKNKFKKEILKRSTKVRTNDNEGILYLLTSIFKKSEKETRDIFLKKRDKDNDGILSTRKCVPYTRSGDKGLSSLSKGDNRFKNDIFFESMGTIDELCSLIGIIYSELQLRSENYNYNELLNITLLIMSVLFDIGTYISKSAEQCQYSIINKNSEVSKANYTNKNFEPYEFERGVHMEHIEEIEKWINKFTKIIPQQTYIILPTGCVSSAQLHIARTVCHRAERRIAPLVKDKILSLKSQYYLNRLSEFLYTASRWVNYCENIEVHYKSVFDSDNYVRH